MLLVKGKVYRTVLNTAEWLPFSLTLSCPSKTVAGIVCTSHTVWVARSDWKTRGVPRQMLKELVFGQVCFSSVSRMPQWAVGRTRFVKSMQTLSEKLWELVGERGMDTGSGTLVFESWHGAFHSQALCSDTCADRPHWNSRSLGSPLGMFVCASWEFVALQNFIYQAFFSPSQGEVGYAKDVKMQVDKTNYLNTYGARRPGLEAQINMQRSTWGWWLYFGES